MLRRGQVAFFAVELVIFKGEQRKFRAFLVAIICFFEDQHIFSLRRRGRPHDPLDLRLRHAVRDLVVVTQGQLRTRECVSIAAWCEREQETAEQCE